MRHPSVGPSRKAFATVRDVTRAQWIFTVGLVVVSLIIVLFAVFVIRTTFWADRWYRRKS